MNASIRIVVSEIERKEIESLARAAGLSLSNYLRARLNLELLTHGGARKREVKVKSPSTKGIDHENQNKKTTS